MKRFFIVASLTALTGLCQSSRCCQDQTDYRITGHKGKYLAETANPNRMINPHDIATWITALTPHETIEAEQARSTVCSALNQLVGQIDAPVNKTDLAQKLDCEKQLITRKIFTMRQNKLKDPSLYNLHSRLIKEFEEDRTQTLNTFNCCDGNLESLITLFMAEKYKTFIAYPNTLYHWKLGTSFEETH